MQVLPIDISEKISSLFTTSEQRNEVTGLIMSLWTIALNVGQDQLARSILILSDGKISEIRRIIDSDFYGDPRDVIVMAEQKVGNPGHYFTQGF